MSELPPAARRAFAEARRQFEPEAARLERVRARVLVDASSAPSWSAMPKKLWVVAVLLGLTGAGVGLSMRTAEQQYEHPAPPEPPRATPRVRHAEGVATESAPPLRAEQPKPQARDVPQLARGLTPTERRASPGAPAKAAPAAAEAAASDVARAPLAAPAASRASTITKALPASDGSSRRSAPLPATASKPPVADALREEAALIERARAALSARDQQQLSAALQEHEARYPAGQLLVERVALKTHAACLANRPAAARAALDQLLLLRPPRALRLDVERTCRPLLSTP